jgi:hypothetical protein
MRRAAKATSCAKWNSPSEIMSAESRQAMIVTTTATCPKPVEVLRESGSLMCRFCLAFDHRLANPKFALRSSSLFRWDGAFLAL